ncbi:hypothetical protein B0H19DRAFT_1067823 [Mycena capillaripes]|nr:hypothetical protein B0H19DRAFT_1067823 [Mycena capillaripes]
MFKILPLLLLACVLASSSAAPIGNSHLLITLEYHTTLMGKCDQIEGGSGSDMWKTSEDSRSSGAKHPSLKSNPTPLSLKENEEREKNLSVHRCGIWMPAPRRRRALRLRGVAPQPATAGAVIALQPASESGSANTMESTGGKRIGSGLMQRSPRFLKKLPDAEHHRVRK